MGNSNSTPQLNLGGEVPREYYMSTKPQAKDYMETANIMAGAGGRKKFKFQVDKADSILRYRQYDQPQLELN